MQYQSQLKRVKSEVQESVDVERQLWHGSNIRFDGTTKKRISLGRPTIRLVTQSAHISGV